MKPAPDRLIEELVDAVWRYLLAQGEEPARLVLVECSPSEPTCLLPAPHIRMVSRTDQLARGPIELLILPEARAASLSSTPMVAWLDWVTHRGHVALISQEVPTQNGPEFLSAALYERGFCLCEDLTLQLQGLVLWRRERAGSEDLVGLKSSLRDLASTPLFLELTLDSLRQKDGENVRLGEQLGPVRDLLCEIGDLEKAWVSALRLDLPEQMEAPSAVDPNQQGALLPHAHRRSLAELLDRFRHLRSRTLHFLGQGPEEAWLKVIAHPFFGVRTRAECVRRAARRDREWRAKVAEDGRRVSNELGGTVETIQRPDSATD
ncbi:MAG TPA: hypothetical protein PKA37_07755 [Planctomycetota bacterium]|nr:hypothetical protein [Planctomycetota bacterium]